MNITIDSAGRLVVPKSIREEAGLRPDVPLEIRCREGCVEIEPAVRLVRRTKKGRVAVALPVDSGQPLANEVVRRVQGALRGRHR